MRQMAKRLLKEFRSRVTGSERCWACGFRGAQVRQSVMWPELIVEWELSPALGTAFDEREGSKCVRCGTNRRSSQLAMAFLKFFRDSLGIDAPCLKYAFRQPRAASLAIA